MARLKPILRYARMIDQRAYAIKRSSAEKGVEILIGFAIATALFRQFETIAMAPVLIRLSAARLLILELVAAWVLLPSIAPVTIPVRLLAFYPLTWKQKVVYRVASILQHWRVFAIIVLSLLSVAVLVRLPHPAVVISKAVAALVIAASVGIGCAIVLPGFRIVRDRRATNGAIPKSHKYPLLRKEIRCYLRTLDFYFALSISLFAALSEFYGNWLSPAKAIVPLLIIALLHIPAFLNPFGLEDSSQLDRYLLTPKPYSLLLATKHMALAILFLVSTLPLDVSLAYQMHFLQISTMAMETCTVVTSCLIVGISLMNKPHAQEIKMDAGKISGSNMSFLFVMQVAVLVAAIPLCEGVTTLYAGGLGNFLIPSGILCAATATYLWLLRKQTWPASRTNNSKT